MTRISRPARVKKRLLIVGPEPSLKTGFSFVEVLVAILTLGVILVPLFRMFSQGASGTVQNREEVLARNMAQSIVNSLRRLDFKDKAIPDWSEMKDVADFSWIEGWDGQKTDTLKRFTFRMGEVREFTVPAVPFKFRTLTLEVTWTSEGIQNSLKVPVLLSEGMNL